MIKSAPLAAAVACATVLGVSLSSFAQNEDMPAEAPGAAAQPAQTDGGARTYAPGEAPAPGNAAAEPAAPAEGAVALDTEVQRLSYALGFMIGSEYGRNEIELDPAVFAKGLASGLAGGEGQMSQEQLQATLMSFQRQMQLRQMQRFEAQAEEGRKFLAENKAKEGVKTTDSGLQYQVLEQGQGEAPAATDTVRVHYRGTLVDGTQFDSSYDRGEPAEFRVDGVIPGWTEALQMMKPGAKYKLVIPSQLAYGETGRPPVIPPNSVLIFDVELLEVVE